MNINSQTVIAVVRLAVALVVAIGAMLGFAVDADMILNVALAIASIVVLVYVWWKNNNVTKAAQESQKVLDAIKGEFGDCDVADVDIEGIGRQSQPIYPSDGKEL